MEPEDLIDNPLIKGISNAILTALEHDEEFLEEFMSIVIHKIKYGHGNWVEELKEVLNDK